MASQNNDNNSEKEIAEEVRVSSSSSEENADTAAHAPSPNSSAPISTPTIQGGAGGATSIEVEVDPVSGDESAVEKKIGKRVEDPGASSTGGDPKKPRKRRDFNDQPQGPPGCYICGKTFKSWRAVFGHMGAHRVSEGRQRGALPPPVVTRSGEASSVKAGSGDGGDDDDDVRRDVLQKQLVPTLLSIAQEGLASSASTSHRADGLDIDLNQPIVDEKEEVGGGGGGQFDLNKLLPWKDKEGDDKDKDGSAPPK